MDDKVNGRYRMARNRLFLSFEDDLKKRLIKMTD